MLRRSQIPGVLAFFLASSLSAADQLTANAATEAWGQRNRTTSNGKVLWFDETAVFLNTGGLTNVEVQQHGTLGAVEPAVFALGSGSAAGDVIGAWRRGTDFAWVTTNGNAPVEVDYTNPFNAANPMNPEAVAVDDGCVFMAFRALAPPNNDETQHIHRVNPVTGVATSLTGSGVVPARVGMLSTSQCKAVWAFDDRPYPLTDPENYKLHYYNGSTLATIDSGIDVDPQISQGRIVYRKTINGMSNVYLYDTNLGSPSVVPLTRYTSAGHMIDKVFTDGRHVGFARRTNEISQTSRHIAAAGGAPLTDATNKPPNGALFMHAGNFPFQLHRGQVYWKDFAGNHRFADSSGISTLTLTPALTVDKPYLADGYLAWLGTSNDGGPDVEVFRQTMSAMVPTSPPIAIVATPLVGAITVAWGEILGASSYNLYVAEAPGVTRDNYLSLAGGRKFTAVAQPYTPTGLENGKTYYFVVTAVEGGIEGASSRQVSATVSGDGWGTVYGSTDSAFYHVTADLQNASILYAAVGDAAGVWKSVDGGNTWAPATGAINGRDVRAVAANGLNVIAVTRDGDILRSMDGGATWTVVADTTTGYTQPQQAVVFDPANPNVMYAAGIELSSGITNFIVKSINGGANWTQLPDNPTFEIRATSLSIDPATGAIYAGGTGVPVAKSIDGGVNWTDVQPRSGFFYALASSSGVTYAAPANFSSPDDSGFGIYKTVNGGTNWTPINTGLPAASPGPFARVFSLAIDPGNPNMLFASTSAGVYVSTDAGANWGVGTVASAPGYTSSATLIVKSLVASSLRRVIGVSGDGFEGGSQEGIFLTGLGPAPTISGVSPLTGPAGGGTAATITGTGFIVTSGLRVLFGGVDATVNLGASSSGSISVTTPAHAPGAVDVKVINPNGAFVVSTNAFTYEDCTFTISPLFANFTSAATAGQTVQVTTSGPCSWMATAPGGSFVTITGGAAGTGSGTVTYSVASNASGSARSSTLTIAARSFTVTQSAAGAALIAMTATASASQVALNWNAVSGATSYTVLRSQGGGAFGVVTSTALLSHADTTVSAGTGYVYRVRAMQSTTELSYSNVDLAVPFAFTDPVLTAANIRAVHFSEAIQALNAARSAAAWTAAAFTDSISAGVVVKRIHLTEMRSVLDGVRAAFGLSASVYTDPSVTAGVTIVKGVHVQQIRDGVK